MPINEGPASSGLDTLTDWKGFGETLTLNLVFEVKKIEVFTLKFVISESETY